MTELNKELLEQAKQENSPELSDEELDGIAGGYIPPKRQSDTRSEAEKRWEEDYRKKGGDPGWRPIL